MVTSSRGGQVLPRWLSALVGGLPPFAALASLILMVATNHPSVFNMTPKDSRLVIGIGSILLGLVVSLLIVCVAQARALKSRSSTP